MSEVTIKGKLAAALHEPNAPPGLVERTVVRAQAIVAGREAEQKLECSDALPHAEFMDLAARSVVGRLMQKQMPPDNVSANMMYKQLQESDVFCRLADQPPQMFLTEVKSGALLRKLSEQTAQHGKQVTGKMPPASNIAKGGPAL